MADDRMSSSEMRQRAGWGIGIALGMGIGVALGAALKNPAMGIGIGVAVGLVFAVAFGASTSGARAGKSGVEEPADDQSEGEAGIGPEGGSESPDDPDSGR